MEHPQGELDSKQRATEGREDLVTEKGQHVGPADREGPGRPLKLADDSAAPPPPAGATAATAPISKRQVFIDEAVRIERRARLVSKAQYVDGRRLASMNRTLGIVVVIFAILAAVIAYVPFTNHELVAAFVALVAAILAAFSTALNAGERSSRHHTAGVQYSMLRERARELRTLRLAQDESLDALIRELRVIAGDHQQLNLASPQHSLRAYKSAMSDPEDALVQPDLGNARTRKWWRR